MPMQATYPISLQIVSAAVTDYYGKSNGIKNKNLVVILPAPTVKITRPSIRGVFNLTFDSIMTYPFNETYMKTLNSTNKGNQFF